MGEKLNLNNATMYISGKPIGNATEIGLKEVHNCGCKGCSYSEGKRAGIQIDVTINGDAINEEELADRLCIYIYKKIVADRMNI